MSQHTTLIMILVSGSEPFVGTAVGMLLLMLPPNKKGGNLCTVAAEGPELRACGRSSYEEGEKGLFGSPFPGSVLDDADCASVRVVLVSFLFTFSCKLLEIKI